MKLMKQLKNIIFKKLLERETFWEESYAAGMIECIQWTINDEWTGTYAFH